MVSLSFVYYHSVDELLRWILIPFYDSKGLSASAIYGVAVFFISFIQMPLKALQPASFTVLSKAFAEDDLPKARDIFIRSSTNILIPTLGVAVILICNINNAISITKNGYSEIAPIFVILFVGNIVNIATGMNDQVLSIAKYYKFNLYLSLLLLFVHFFLLTRFIPIYGLYGAAWSTTIVLMLFNFAKCWFVWRKLDIQPFTINSLKTVLCALPALAVGYFFPYFFNPDRHVYIHTFADAAMRSTIIIVIYMLMLIWLKPSKDLKEYLDTVVKNKRLF